MSEIKRYIPAAGVLEDERIIYMRDNGKGEWVRHTDHLTAMQQARIDAVREFGEWCEDAYMLEDVTVVIAAKKYIEQLKEQGE
jgi:hypothetical protein